jgi:hypothetical protein
MTPRHALGICLFSILFTGAPQARSSDPAPAPPPACRSPRPVSTDEVRGRIEGDDSMDIDGLLKIGENAVPALVQLTAPSVRPYLRARATHVLGSFPCKESVDRIDALIGDSDYAVRIAAVRSLAQTRGRAATPRLAGALRDRDTGVQKFTLKELARVGDARAIAPIEAFRAATPHAWLKDLATAALASIRAR